MSKSTRAPHPLCTLGRGSSWAPGLSMARSHGSQKHHTPGSDSTPPGEGADPSLILSCRYVPRLYSGVHPPYRAPLQKGAIVTGRSQWLAAAVLNCDWIKPAGAVSFPLPETSFRTATRLKPGQPDQMGSLPETSCEGVPTLFLPVHHSRCCRPPQASPDPEGRHHQHAPHG